MGYWTKVQKTKAKTFARPAIRKEKGGRDEEDEVGNRIHM